MFSKAEEKTTAEVVSLRSDDMSTISTEPELPPYINEAAVQSYDVIYKDWKCTRAFVQDPESKEILYNCDLPSLRRCRINLRSAIDDVEIATGNPYSLKKHISSSVRGQDLDLRYKNLLKCNYTYTSPAFGNSKMTWTCHSGFKEMVYVLLDEQSLPVARWKTSGPKVGPFKDLGRLEILGTRVDSDAAKEEILITGLTLVFLEVIARSNGTFGVSAISTMVAVGSGSG